MLARVLRGVALLAIGLAFLGVVSTPLLLRTGIGLGIANWPWSDIGKAFLVELLLGGIGLALGFGAEAIDKRDRSGGDEDE